MSTLKTDVLKDVAETVTVNTVDLPGAVNLRSDLANATDPAKGAGLVGISQYRTLADRLAEHVNLLDHGAVGDGVTVDDAAILAAITEAATRGVAIRAPAGYNFLVTAPITCPDALKDGFTFLGDGVSNTTFTYTGTGEFFQMDPSAIPATATRRNYWRVGGFTVVGPGKGVAGSVGLHLNNCLFGTLEPVFVTGFESNIVFDAHDLANGAACYYNTINQPISANCIDGLVFLEQANSNTVHGGKLLTADGAGLRINKTTTNVNLHGVTIEGNNGKGAVIDGYGNSLFGCRFENPLASIELHFNEIAGVLVTSGAKNTVISYFSSPPGSVTVVVDDSLNKNNTIIWPGYMQFGDSSEAIAGNVIAASRSIAANLEPFLDFSDTSASSGSPVGLRYRYARFGTTPIQLQKIDGVGGFWTQFAVQIDSGTGQPKIELGSGSAAPDVTLQRSGPGFLDTLGYFKIGTVGALPAASVTYRGRMIRVEGGAGVADAIYICQKNAADGYVWVLIA